MRFSACENRLRPAWFIENARATRAVDPHGFDGNAIPHMRLDADMTVSDLVDAYAASGYNARSLGEAAKVYLEMIRSGATICLTISGALSPVGLGGAVRALMERGFVDWVITTGANVYHEDHFAWGLPVRQGSADADDNILFNKEIVRIRDVYVRFYDTLEAQDQVVQKYFEDALESPFTTAEFCHRMGRMSQENAPHPELSFVSSAYRHGIPVYVSTLKDSSLALNLAIGRMKGRVYSLDLVREILEQAAIVYNSDKSGILELGGGVPKNSAQQTGPLLDQILRRNDGGQDYIVQVTDARPDTGGLSGATLQEGKSWGKVQDARRGMVTVYTDATIAFPLLALYAISNHAPRPQKRLYDRLGEYYDTLRADCMKNP